MSSILNRVLGRMKGQRSSPAGHPNDAVIDEALHMLATGASELRGPGLVALQALPAEADDRLAAVASSDERPSAERLWAVYAVLRRGADVSGLLDRLDEPRVPVPGLPDVVREAILRDVGVESMGDGADLRWFIEAMQMGAVHGLDDEYSPVPALVPALVAALDAEGLACGEPVDYGDLKGPPALSNYYILGAGGVDLRLSRVGPFVAAVEAAPPDRLDRCHRAAAAAGWHWLDYNVLDLEVTGLVVNLQDGYRIHRVEDYLFSWWWADG